MIQTIVGKKLGQLQGFLEDGARIPMTKIEVAGNVVSQVKTVKKDGYDAVQLGFGSTMKADKPTIGHSKKAGLTTVPRFFKETRVDKVEDVELGQAINVEEILEAGDRVDVTGTSKGKGFAGVVKRHHFKGGPKTHGQSDRHRAPGSIGQSTTPGRVYKGKRMAGHMGAAQVTVQNLEVIEFTDGVLLLKGLIPGPISSIVTITRRGKNKKHQGLYKEPVIEEVVIDEAVVEEIGPSVEEQEALRQETDAKVEAEEKAAAAEAQVANQSDANTATGETKDKKEVISENPESQKAGESEVQQAEKSKEDAESDSVSVEKTEEASEAVSEDKTEDRVKS